MILMVYWRQNIELDRFKKLKKLQEENKELKAEVIHCHAEYYRTPCKCEWCRNG